MSDGFPGFRIDEKHTPLPFLLRPLRKSRLVSGREVSLRFVRDETHLDARFLTMIAVGRYSKTPVICDTEVRVAGAVDG